MCHKKKLIILVFLNFVFTFYNHLLHICTFRETQDKYTKHTYIHQDQSGYSQRQ